MQKKILLLMLLILMGVFTSCSSQVEPEFGEMRAVWLTNVDSEVMNSRENIKEAMQLLQDLHFNAVFPVVWNDAKTLFQSALMDSTFGYAIDPRYAGRDPLTEIIEEAHPRGIIVIPWFEYGFATSYNKNGGRILEVKPEWAARDNTGKLLAKNGFEWMNAYHPDVQEFMQNLVLEVVANYDVDGVQGDDRLPAQPVEGGYSDVTRGLYAEAHSGQQPPDNFDNPEWKRWRADKLNVFAQTLYKKVKSVKPKCIISWAPSIYPWSYDEYLQDWPAWFRGGYADVVLPQVYRYSIEEYRRTLTAINDKEHNLDKEHLARVFPGILVNIADYVIPDDYFRQALKLNRAEGFRGESLFFFEGLRWQQGRAADVVRENYPQSVPLPVNLRNILRPVVDH